LADANSNLSDELLEEKNTYQPTPLKNANYDGINKGYVRDNLLEELKNNNNLNILKTSSSYMDETKLQDIKNIKEIKSAKKYYETQLNSEAEKNFKKIVATAMVIEKEVNKTKELQEMPTNQIATVVDKNLSQSKVVYKIGQGEMTNIEGIEAMLDNEVSATEVVITQTTAQAGEKIGAKIGMALGSVFGPAGTVVGGQIGAMVGRMGGHVVGEVIHYGLKKVVPVVVEMIKSAGNWVKKTIGNIAKKTVKFFNKLFS